MILLLFLFAAFFPFRASAAEPGPEDFVGSDVCVGCHDTQIRSMSKSHHWKKAVKDAPVNTKGCEACHGPGAAHVEKGGGTLAGLVTFAKNEAADRKSAACLSCHENGPPVALWDSGIHKKKDVACSDCHSAHRPAAIARGYGTGMMPLGYVPGPQYQTCGRCHLDVKAQVNRRSHHPIVEGRITCSNCHQPHGSMNPSEIRAASVNQLCYKCHADKRGPFMWEHAPVEENCGNCHAPHGSVHLKLNIESIPNMCQGCHDAARHPGTRYSAETLFRGTKITGLAASPSDRSFARSCLNCHSNIHGSNAPANPANQLNSGKFFVR